MSKAIKQMQMDAMKQTFSGVKNMVVISSTKLGAIAENQLRLSLRKKNIRLHQVKNSLARKVFNDIGIRLDVWGGCTVFCWGPESVKELSKGLEAAFKEQEKKDPKFKEKVTVKTAVAEGQPVSFADALKMPTRLEAIGEIVGAIAGPGSHLAADGAILDAPRAGHAVAPDVGQRHARIRARVHDGVAQARLHIRVHPQRADDAVFDLDHGGGAVHDYRRRAVERLQRPHPARAFPPRATTWPASPGTPGAAPARRRRAR